MKGRRGNYKRRVRRATRKIQKGFWIYEHWIDNTVYVGLTARDPWARFEEHKESAMEGSKTKFHTALREAHYKTRMEVWRYQSEKEMAKEEVDRIALYKAKGQPIFNLTRGGEVAKGRWKYDTDGNFVFIPKKTRWKGKFAWRKKHGN